MSDINIRNVDEGLRRELKMEAAKEGMTLREYCLALLSGAKCKSRKWNKVLPSVSDPDPIREAKQDRMIDRQMKARAEREARKAYVPPRYRKT